MHALCSATIDMLKALGPRLQLLSIVYKPLWSNHALENHVLVPTIVRHCPLLTHLHLEDMQPVVAAEVSLQ